MKFPIAAALLVLKESGVVGRVEGTVVGVESAVGVAAAVLFILLPACCILFPIAWSDFPRSAHEPNKTMPEYKTVFFKIGIIMKFLFFTKIIPLNVKTSIFLTKRIFL